MNPLRKTSPLLFFLLVHGWAGAVDVALPDIETPAGREVTIPVTVSELTGLGVYAFDLSITFEGGWLDVIDVKTAGTLSAGWGAPTYNATEGRIQVGMGGTSPLAGQGALLHVVFSIPGDAAVGVRSDLHFESFSFNEGTPPAQSRDGSVTVIADTEPPVILSGPTVHSIASGSARVRWTTDEPATSEVFYGQTDAYDSHLIDETLTTQHSVSITGLSASTEYHYNVLSADGLGNGPTESGDRSFTTADIVVSLAEESGDPGTSVALPMSVTDVTGQEIRSLSLALDFDGALVSFARLTTDGTLTGSWNVDRLDVIPGRVETDLSGTGALSGSGILLTLEFTVAEDAAVGSVTDVALATFAFNDGTPPSVLLDGRISVVDTEPPVIVSGPEAVDVNSRSATIRWQTDKPSTSRVEYGPTAGYGHTTVLGGYVTEHAVPLFPLQPDEMYHYRVFSVDAQGNGPVVSPDGTFFTEASAGILVTLPDTTVSAGGFLSLPIRVSDLTDRGVFSISLLLGFDPRLFRLSEVQSGLLILGWGEPAVTTAGGITVVRVRGDAPISGAGELLRVGWDVERVAQGTVNSGFEFLEFRFNDGYPRADFAGGTVTLTGPPDTTPPSFALSPVVEGAGSESARVAWTTDENTTGIVEYGETVSYGYTVEAPSEGTLHRVELTGLNPGTVYHFRVGAVDAAGNGPVWSGDGTLETSEPGWVGVSLPDASAGADETFSLAVGVSDLSGLEVFSYEIVAEYDPTLLTATGATSSGTLSGSWGPPVVTVQEGRVVIAAGGIASLSGSGSLVKVNFRASASAEAGEEGLILLTKCVLNEGTPPAYTKAGQVTIQDVDPPEFVTGPDVRLITGTSAAVIWSTDEAATSRLDFGLSEAYGGRNEDARLVERHGMALTGLERGSEYHVRAGSADGLGQGPALSADRAFQTRGADTLSFFLPDATAYQGGSVSLPLHVSDATSKGVQSLGFVASFDAALLTFRSLETEGTLSSSWQAPQSVVTTEGVEVNLSGPASLSGGGVLVRLVFDVPPDAAAGQSASIELHAFEFDQSFLRAAARSGRVSVEGGAHAIDGTVVDDGGLPVGGAVVSADDGSGGVRSAITNGNGLFRIAGLSDQRAYTVTATKFGYREGVVTGVVPDATITIRMARDFGSISGRALDAAGGGMADVLITLTTADTGQETGHARTDASGGYAFEGVLPGAYGLSASLAGYLSDPAQADVTVGPGQRVEVDFTLSETQITAVNIVGDAYLPNDRSAVFTARAMNTEGATVPAGDLSWSLEPAGAGGVEDGVLTPNPQYFGWGQISVTEASSGLSDHLDIGLYAPLGPDSDILLHDDTGLRLSITPGVLPYDTDLSLEASQLPAFKRVTRAYSASGVGYALKPKNVAFVSPAMLTLPVASENDASGRIGLWDEANGEWVLPESQENSGGPWVSAGITELGLYAVLDPARPLGIHDVTFRPNPFSPRVDTDGDGQPGLTISFRVTSRDARTPFVTLKIYNMSGSLVRELLKGDPVEKGRVKTATWDGLTDDGRMARNGRYILRIEARDSGGIEDSMGTAVLIQ